MIGITRRICFKHNSEIRAEKEFAIIFLTRIMLSVIRPGWKIGSLTFGNKVLETKNWITAEDRNSRLLHRGRTLKKKINGKLLNRGLGGPIKVLTFLKKSSKSVFGP